MIRNLNRRTLLFLFLCMLILVISIYGQNQQRDKKLPVQLETSAGRFQIIMNPEIRMDRFLLDTQTGRVWELAREVELQDEPRIWVVLPRIDNDQQMREWLATQHNKKKP